MKFKNKRNALVNWIGYNEVFLMILGFIALPVLFYGLGNFEANVIRNSGNISEFWADCINSTGFLKILNYEILGMFFCLYWCIKILLFIICVALALFVMFSIVYTVAKQPAIIRAAKLPLTVEEIKEGMLYKGKSYQYLKKFEDTDQPCYKSPAELGIDMREIIDEYNQKISFDENERS